MGKENIPQQYGQAVAPQGVRGGLVTALVGLVNHVIMHEGGQMHHFQQGSQPDVGFLDAARGAGYQQNQGRPEHFPLGLAHCFHVVGDFRVKTGCLGFHKLRNLLQFRLDQLKIVLLGS